MESKLKVVFSVLAYFFPPREKPPLDNYDIELVRKKFLSVERKLILYLFTLTPILIAILFLFFSKLQEWYLVLSQGESIHIEGVSSAAFFLPALFTGLLLSGLIITRLVKYHAKRLSSDESEFEVFYYDLNVRHSLGNEVSNLGVYVVVLIPTILSLLIILPLGLRNYTKFDDNGITYSRFFSLREERFSHQDIERIIYITSFKNLQTEMIEQTRPYYLVIMNDGTRWNTLNLQSNGAVKELELIRMLSDKSGAPIETGVKNVNDVL
jgi:hypothetical protein